jgi:DNA topoisomerase-6 subunit B
VADATVTEMDGEWFVKWAPTVGSGERAVLEYDLGEETTFDVQVNGVEDEKLTVNA